MGKANFYVDNGANPVPQVQFRVVRDEDGNIDLYASDGSHEQCLLTVMHHGRLLRHSLSAVVAEGWGITLNTDDEIWLDNEPKK